MDSAASSELSNLLLESLPHSVEDMVEDLDENVAASRPSSAQQQQQQFQQQQHFQEQQHSVPSFPVGGALFGGGRAFPPHESLQFSFHSEELQQRRNTEQAMSRERTAAWVGQAPTSLGDATSSLSGPLPSSSLLMLNNNTSNNAPRTSDPAGLAAPGRFPAGVAGAAPSAGTPSSGAPQPAEGANTSSNNNGGNTMALLTNLPLEQQQMLVHLGIVSPDALGAAPTSQQQQQSSTHHDPTSDPASNNTEAAAAAVSSLEAAEALWQQAVSAGADDQTLLMLAAQLGLITTDASGQGVLTRDLLHQQLGLPPPQQHRVVVATPAGFVGPASSSSLGGVVSPTTSAPLPRLGSSLAQQPQPQSLEALLAGVQSAGMLGQLLGLVAGLGGAGGRLLGKHMGSPGPSKQHALYKTELCRGWLETGTCRYGAKCQFAHGREELRPVPRHPKYKTEVCRSFAATGVCAYGARCRFIHGSVSAPHNAIFFPGGDAAGNASSAANALSGLHGSAALGTTAALRPSDASLLASSSMGMGHHEGLEGVLGFDEPSVSLHARGAGVATMAQAGPLGLRQAAQAAAGVNVIGAAPGAATTLQQQQQREAARMAAMTQLMAARLLGVQHPTGGAGNAAAAAAGSRVSLDNSVLSGGNFLFAGGGGVGSARAAALTGRASGVMTAAAGSGVQSESQRMSIESMQRHAAMGPAGASGSLFSAGSAMPGGGPNRMSLESCVSQQTDTAGYLRCSGELPMNYDYRDAQQQQQYHQQQQQQLQLQQQQQAVAARAGMMYAGGAGAPPPARSAGLGPGMTAGAATHDAATLALLQALQHQQPQQYHPQQVAGGGVAPPQHAVVMLQGAPHPLNDAGARSAAAVAAAVQQQRAAASGVWHPQQPAPGGWELQQQQAQQVSSAYKSGLYALAPAAGGRAAAAVGGRQASPRLSNPGVVTPEQSEMGMEPGSDLNVMRR